MGFEDRGGERMSAGLNRSKETEGDEAAGNEIRRRKAKEKQR